jgi:hypothetical protein
MYREIVKTHNCQHVDEETLCMFPKKMCVQCPVYWYKQEEVRTDLEIADNMKDYWKHLGKAD